MMSTHRLCLVVLGGFAALVGASHAAGQSRPAALAPDWDVAIEPGVEWCAPVDGEPGTALLVCAKDARVDLIDVESGASRLAQRIAVQPGTQFAGGSGAMACAYGPARVCAFRVRAGNAAGGAGPGLLWAADAAPSATTEGDPEFMTRVTAAEATPAGVLIVRSDGAVAELRRDDGTVRWSARVAEAGSCDLHVSGQSAAVLLKRGQCVDVAFFDLQAEPPRAAVVAVGDTPPLWSRMVEGRLLAVWPTHYRMISAAGVNHLGRLPPTIVPTARTVAVYVPPPAAAGEKRGAALLLAQNADGYTCALDLDAWTWDIRRADPSLISERGDFAPRLYVDGDRIIRADLRWAVIEDAATRATLAELHGAGSVLGVGVRDDSAYALFWDQRPAEDVGTFLRQADGEDAAEHERGLAVLARTRQPQTLTLIRQGIANHVPQRPARSARCAPSSYQLGIAGPVHETFWLERKLVVVEAERIRAYTLP